MDEIEMKLGERRKALFRFLHDYHDSNAQGSQYYLTKRILVMEFINKILNPIFHKGE